MTPLLSAPHDHQCLGRITLLSRNPRPLFVMGTLQMGFCFCCSAERTLSQGAGDMCSALLSRSPAALSNMDNYRLAVVKSALLSAPADEGPGLCVLAAEVSPFLGLWKKGSKYKVCTLLVLCLVRRKAENNDILTVLCFKTSIVDYFHLGKGHDELNYGII